MTLVEGGRHVGMFDSAKVRVRTRVIGRLSRGEKGIWYVLLWREVSDSQFALSLSDCDPSGEWVFER